jgi:large subunit ribosomal protein L27e
MGKFIKPGKIVIVLQGRFAGRKAIVVKTFDEGTKDHEYGHALIAGIDRYPLRVTKSMSQKKIVKRSKIKPFIKHVNYNHLMPTRYTVSDIDLKAAIKPEALKKEDTKIEARKSVKKAFEDRYLNRGKNTGGVQYFFQKLRF